MEKLNNNEESISTENKSNNNKSSGYYKNISETAEQAPPLLEIIKRTLQQWPRLLLSICVFIALGVLYLLVTPKTYTQQAALLIKNDGEGTSASAMLNEFSNMGLFSNSSDEENEKETLKSPDLMEEVIKNLNLTYTYYKKGSFKNTVLYGTTLPITVYNPELNDKSQAKFDLKVSPDGNVKISNIKIKKDNKKIKYSKEYTGKLNTAIPTDIGPITVIPTSYYKPEDKALDLVVKKSPLSSTIIGCSSKLDVSIVNKFSSVIYLSYRDYSVEKADSVLANLIKVYNQIWIKDKNIQTEQASKFIQERLAVIAQELGNVDSNISSYKSENLVPDLSLTASTNMNSKESLSKSILEASSQLSSLYEIKGGLNASGQYNMLPANTGLSDASLINQVDKYNSMIIERNRLTQQTSDKNPLVMTLDKDISGLHAAISGAVDNQIKTLETSIKDMQQARQAAISQLASNPAQAKDLLGIERQQKVMENLYLFLLQKKEDTELTQSFTSYNNRVIMRPGGSTSPSSPKTAVVLIGCFILGACVPFFYEILLDSFNTKVRNKQELSRVKIPRLGEIPLVPHKISKLFVNKPIVQPGNRDIVNEAFRVLRTNINFARVNKSGCNVFAITSFNPGSGKTFISYNVAVAFAIRHKKVLLIDADLRTGALSKYVGSPEYGLTDYLDGEIKDVNSIMVTSPETPTMQIIPIGHIAPTPTELIEQPQFKDLLDKMREEYDLIIIDCPPVNIVADAKIIDQFTDRTIFVLRMGVMQRSNIPVLNEMNKDGEYKRMCYILNGTPYPKGKYGYRSYSDYAYGVKG